MQVTDRARQAVGKFLGESDISKVSDKLVCEVSYCAHWGIPYVKGQRGRQADVESARDLVMRFGDANITKQPAIIRKAIESAKETIRKSDASATVPVLK